MVKVKAQVVCEVTPCRLVNVFSGFRGGSYPNDGLLDACNEMGRVCGTCWGQKRCKQDFCPETTAKENT